MIGVHYVMAVAIGDCFSGHPYSSYQRVLLSNAATSALRLHQRMPNFQFSRAYIASLFLEDSAHYLFFSLVFLTSSPVSSILCPMHLLCKGLEQVLCTRTHTHSHTQSSFRIIGALLYGCAKATWEMLTEDNFRYLCICI